MTYSRICTNYAMPLLERPLMNHVIQKLLLFDASCRKGSESVDH